MKKTFSLIAIFTIALFVLPFGQSVLAADSGYDHIKNGDYPITAKAMHADKNEASGAASFISEEATLSVQDGTLKLTIKLPPNAMAEIKDLQIEGVKPVKSGENWSYTLADLSSELNAKVHYVVPSMDMDHEVPFRFLLEGLDKLPVVDTDEDSDKDAEKPESEGTNEDQTEDNNPKGELVKNADETHEVEFITDSSSTQKQFDNPATLLIKDGKKYIQMSGAGGQFIKSLTVNGTKVNWVKRNDDGTFVIQFALPGSLTEKIDFGMTIAPPGMKDMNHTVPLSFKEPVLEDTEDENQIIKNPDKKQEVNYVTDSQSTKKNFNNPVSLLIKDGKKYIQMSGTGGQFIKSLTVNGTEVNWVTRNDDGTFVIQFALLGSLTDEIDFGMTIAPPGMKEMQHTIPMSFEENKEEPNKDGSDDESDKEEPNKEKPNKQDPVNDLTIPDKAYGVDYIINNEDGTKVSISNDFFVKPAYLFEKDGKKYIQMTIKNGDMIKKLSNKYGDALIVKKNKDGSIVVQLRVDNNLADMLLDMHIVVPEGAIPGFSGYNQDHKAILVFNKDSVTEADASKFNLVAGTKDNTNGPTVKGSKPGNTVGDNDTPIKPTFGENGTTNNNVVTPNKTNTTHNPKTGDTSNIILFSLLLIGSLIPLAIQYRRRTI